MAERIQLKRTKGWQLPESAVKVDRTTRWGNPWRVDEHGQRQAVARFRLHLAVRRNPPVGWSDLIGYPSDEEIRTHLAGKSLACWCPEGEPCHADVLMAVAAGMGA